ncbi:hypothetical protein D3C72_1485690 [compost metagenome]
MYDSIEATRFDACRASSQPPPSARPATAAITGTFAYFSDMKVFCSSAMIGSTAFTPPCMNAGRADCRSAPAENAPPSAASACQITRPLKFFSASAKASFRPLMTPSPITCILVLNEMIRTSSPVCQTRTDSSSKTVVPAVLPSMAPLPRTGARNGWRSYTDRVERGTKLFDTAEYEPSGVCTPPLSATGPSKTQAGSGALHSAWPASMSSLTQLATCSQFDACHVSNGPTFQPKPQRMAKSMSRALSATVSRWMAM